MSLVGSNPTLSASKSRPAPSSQPREPPDKHCLSYRHRDEGEHGEQHRPARRTDHPEPQQHPRKHQQRRGNRRAAMSDHVSESAPESPASRAKTNKPMKITSAAPYAEAAAGSAQLYLER